MTRCDVLIVGGGPAGSTCAWALQRAGADVLVIDRAAFPRDKICAGWITPPVLAALDLDPDAYRRRGRVMEAFRGFRTGVIAGGSVETRYDTVVSYGIRRCEFDEFLLQRSAARVLQNTMLRTLARARDRWIVNGEIEARLVVGAGGHFCPVARRLRGRGRPVDLVVAQEIELPIDDHHATAPDCPDLFFCRDLQGYGWAVRKGGFLNVGFGRRTSGEFIGAARAFAAWLEREGRAPASVTNVAWHGHAYLLASADSGPVLDDHVLLVGDAAGLAYRESGEGIRPAVESGLLAARAIVGANGRYGRTELQPYADALRAHRPADRGRWLPSSLTASIGRLLLASPTFTRHVVLDRWFLRRDHAPLDRAVLARAA